jgi:hypothetical protein
MNEYPKISAIAARAGLGEVVRRYRMALWLELTYLVTFSVIGLISLIVGYQTGRTIGVVALVLAAAIAVATWRKAHKFLYLCTDGLLTTVGRGPVVKARCRWDDVTRLRRWSTRIYNAGGSEYGIYEQFPRCTVYAADETRIHLHRGPYHDAAELAALIEQRTAPVIHARRDHELATTGAATFGPLVLTREGVRAGQRFAAWSKITRAEFGRVRLRIWTGTTRPTISRQTRTIPDVAVLRAMMAEQLPSRQDR